MKSLHARSVIIAITSVALTITSTNVLASSLADTLTETVKLVHSDPGIGNSFGNAVALSGNRALVGDIGDSPGGSVSIFSRQGSGSWERTAFIENHDLGDLFGRSVALSGDTGLIGAPRDDLRGRNSGSATIIREGVDGDWQPIATLIGSDTVADDLFGLSVATTSSAVVVGSPHSNNLKGAAYVFRADGQGNWHEEAKLTASDAGRSDRFGSSVSIFGDMVLVGASGAGNSSGAAYIFRNDGAGKWREVDKFWARDIELGEHFGASVALYGNTAIIGTSKIAEVFVADSAYVFRDDGTGAWSQVAELNVGIVESALSVALGDGVAIVGDPGHHERDAGAAYVYHEDDAGNWNLKYSLAASDAMVGDGFGGSVAVSDSAFMVGAPSKEVELGGRGSAYLFVVPAPSSETLVCGLLASGIVFCRKSIVRLSSPLL